MNSIKAIWQNGRVVLEGQADWPEGRRLVVSEDPTSEDAHDHDPESLARWIAEFDAIPALEMTPAEEAQWQSARAMQKELEKKSFAGRADELRRLCD